MKRILHIVLVVMMFLIASASCAVKAEGPVRVNLVTVPNPYRFVRDQVGNRKIERVLETACPADGVLVIVVARTRDVWSAKATTPVERLRVVKNAAVVIREVSASPPYTDDFSGRVAAVKRALLYENEGSVSFNEITLGSPSASYSPSGNSETRMIPPPPMYDPGRTEGPPPALSTPSYLPKSDDTVKSAFVMTGIAAMAIWLGYVQWRKRKRLQEALNEKIDEMEQQLVEEERNAPRRFSAPMARVFLNILFLALLCAVHHVPLSSQTSRQIRSSHNTEVRNVQREQLSKPPETSAGSPSRNLTIIAGDYNIVDISGSTKWARRQAKQDIRTRLALGNSRQFLWAFGDSLVWFGEISSPHQLDTLDHIRSHNNTRITEPVLEAIRVADSLYRRGLQANFVLYSDFRPDDLGNASLEFTADWRQKSDKSLSAASSADSGLFSVVGDGKLILYLIIIVLMVVAGAVISHRRPQKLAGVPKRILLTAERQTRTISGKELLSRTIKIGKDLDSDLRISNGDTLKVYTSGTTKVPTVILEHSHLDSPIKIEFEY